MDPAATWRWLGLTGGLVNLALLAMPILGRLEPAGPATRVRSGSCSRVEHAENDYNDCLEMFADGGLLGLAFALPCAAVLPGLRLAEHLRWGPADAEDWLLLAWASAARGQSAAGDALQRHAVALDPQRPGLDIALRAGSARR